MPTLMEEVIQNRIYTPTEEDLESTKRVGMTLENARKTLTRKKTQTRRLQGLDKLNKDPDEWSFIGSAIETGLEGGEKVFHFKSDGEHVRLKCPYGEPGDRLLITTKHWRADTGTEKDRIWDPVTGVVRFAESKRGGPNAVCVPETDGWTPPEEYDWHQIHAPHLMPRWASRIAIEIENVRAERVQETSSEDAAAEGVEWDDWGVAEPSNKWLFRQEWNKIHDNGAWERNSWVWALDYELIITN